MWKITAIRYEWVCPNFPLIYSMYDAAQACKDMPTVFFYFNYKIPFPWMSGQFVILY